LSILDTSFVTLVGRPSLIVTNGGFLFSAHRWKLSGTTGIARGFRSYNKIERALLSQSPLYWCM
ncbi:MAG: hypothetical protein SOR93_16835, partial [Clostridiales Family XIII bacterium]|nr:hypothetical protein [Clostridiales Family XIII bacterium]